MLSGGGGTYFIWRQDLFGRWVLFKKWDGVTHRRRTLFWKRQVNFSSR
jgi:hypothetical protein